MKKILYCLFVFTLAFSSCKKQKNLPEPDLTQPEFYVSCNMDGAAMKLEAGNDDYYMNSSWYQQDSSHVSVYKAHLKKKLGNGYEITILINDANESTLNGPVEVEKGLSIGQHLYNDKIIPGETQEVSFKSLGAASGNNYWTVLDGSASSTDPVSGQSFSAFLNVGKTYSVVLNYDDGIGVCATTHTNIFKAGSDLQTTIQVHRRTDLPELQYELSYSLPSYSASSYSSFSCRWDFENDNSFSTQPTLVKLFTEGKHRIKLSLKDEKSGEVCESYYQLSASNRNICEANYVAEFKPIKNTRIYSSVTVLLTDPNGLVYSSQNLVQPATSQFDLTDVADYDLNENAQPTKRIKLKFNCVVKNGDKEINLSNGEAVVAVAHK